MAYVVLPKQLVGDLKALLQRALLRPKEIPSQSQHAGTIYSILGLIAKTFEEVKKNATQTSRRSV
jgi:hypothetical protein